MKSSYMIWLFLFFMIVFTPACAGPDIKEASFSRHPKILAVELDKYEDNLITASWLLDLSPRDIITSVSLNIYDNGYCEENLIFSYTPDNNQVKVYLQLSALYSICLPDREISLWNRTKWGGMDGVVTFNYLTYHNDLTDGGVKYDFYLPEKITRKIHLSSVYRGELCDTSVAGEENIYHLPAADFEGLYLEVCSHKMVLESLLYLSNIVKQMDDDFMRGVGCQQLKKYLQTLIYLED